MKERLSAVAEKTDRHKGTVMICFVAFLIALAATACSVGGTTPASTESPLASVPIDIQDVWEGDQLISYVSEGNSDTKESTSNDIVSSTEKENEAVSELKTLTSILQWDVTSYIVTNGSTGEQVSLATSSDVDKMKSLLDGVSILRQDDGDVSAGYLYAIRAVDENGNLSDAICVLNGHVKTDGRIGYYVENDVLLINYLESLY